jgi:hypothetical protein
MRIRLTPPIGMLFWLKLQCFVSAWHKATGSKATSLNMSLKSENKQRKREVDEPVCVQGVIEEAGLDTRGRKERYLGG